jgi:excisionase family DNA binding protein
MQETEMTSMLDADALWDALDVARYLKVSRNWVYQQADAGRLPSIRIAGVRRFDPSKIRALAESGGF